MSRFIIHGQRKLAGEYRPVGNKNAVLPMLAACLLTDEPVTLRNVPDIRDVEVMLALLEGVGVGVARERDRVTLQAGSIRRRRLDPELCRRVRASILLAAPLAARHGSCVLPPPGGDIIGRRRLDTHFNGLRALGIAVEGGTSYTLRRRQLRGADFLLDEASVTATENLLMAATLAEGETTLFNAACEPHVTDLGALLVRMGARIEGLGTNCLQIQGVKTLRGAEHTVGPDLIEVGSFLAAAAATRGELRVSAPGNLRDLEVILRVFARLGVETEAKAGDLHLPARQKRRVQRDLGRAIPKIEDGPWPQFPSDLMSVAIVLATQAKGTVLFFEKMFESRMYFVDRLIEMGADIIPCDPHRVVVSGPCPLHGTHLTTPDIRAGMSLLIAALCAKGRSVIDQAEVIDRGYERIDERLRALGADIVREG
ncbi:MAG: UDP-N-acetylglucosamine 1-carboxyvinyltransferase [Kiritimatiellae bacterium]|nr:UDP-N-acetylglucosamine 1-carboxyvinyltransferase [Kiritimatiellia bacterium]